MSDLTEEEMIDRIRVLGTHSNPAKGKARRRIKTGYLTAALVAFASFAAGFGSQFWVVRDTSANWQIDPAAQEWLVFDYADRLGVTPTAAREILMDRLHIQKK
ncbi:hypothetical protein [Falsiruegeria mediterranea]|uniref:Uncharacterized protein n=1 Tax=Falsiruegeria mediterranea M17 TaxID=1200281 RepID=A0A2R8C5F3_9RHOB|nr:hypothetical protein [Falsiruegeria mediterranea]SPJ27650.1 hypothetical protein TRM7615_01140 [Falsiruegeria mediterranea M17]